jgi:hypothetical protein
MRGDRKYRARTLALAALALAALLLVPGLAGAGWDGEQVIVLGDKAGAEFLPADGAVHSFGFYAPADTVVSVAAKPAAGSNLVLGFALFTDRDEVVPLGAALVPDGKGIKNLKTTAAGWYRLEVTAQSGSGAYLLTTKGKFPRAINAKVTLGSNLKGEFQFGAFDGTVFAGKIKGSKGSPATTPKFDALTCPGDDMGITPGPALANLALHETNLYTLDLSGNAAGDVDLALKLKLPKFVKRTWSFGPVEMFPGTAPGIYAAWKGSGHGEYGSEAFRHWDADGSVSASCAKCHSGAGFEDFVGADGSAFGTIDNTIPLDRTVDCAACHNPEAASLSAVTFPSGKTVVDLGPEARCLQCHQGRESTTSMNTMIALSALADDAVATGSVPSGQPGAPDKLSFKNVHYFSAGATLYGNLAQGAYQYAGKVYPDKFNHVESYDSCVECHDMHSLEVRGSACVSCHTGTDYASYRMTRSTFDYDGDGNVTEGIKGEIDTLAALLYDAIKAYAPAATTNGIVYDPSSHPYWFKDANLNGVRDTGEGSFTSWTPRLVRAAYNFQYYQKDPGAYAHNSRYMIALLYDGLEDLDSHASVTVPGMANLVRNDHNHFDYSAQAWNYSYFYPEVRAGCVRCHSPEGFKFYAQFVTKSSQTDYPGVVKKTYGGMNCESCHETDANFGLNPALRPVAAVWFPGGKVVENTASDPSFTCLTCHQGREGKGTVDSMIAASGLADDAVATGTVPNGQTGAADKLSFKNLHYLPAGATLYGKDAGVGYEYAGKTYEAKWVHQDASKSRCTFCHVNGDHSFTPRLTDGTAGTANCKLCHGTGTLEEQRLNRLPDYDGDAATTTLPAEMEAFEDHLYDAIKAYAAANGGGIVYDAASHPYFFEDLNEDGVPDVNGTGGKIGYRTFTPRLVRATFNFQFAHKEPGAWAHHTKYMLQLLYDSAQDLGADMTGFTRP